MHVIRTALPPASMEPKIPASRPILVDNFELPMVQSYKYPGWLGSGSSRLACRFAMSGGIEGVLKGTRQDFREVGSTFVV